MRFLYITALFFIFSGILVPIGMTQDQKKSVNRGKPTEGFQVSAIAENSSVTHGQPVRLKISIKNISAKMLYLAEVGTEKDYRIQISRDGGKPVPLTPHGKALSQDTDVFMNLSLQMQPHQERTDTLELSSIFDMTTPGDYSISVSRRVGLLVGKGVAEARSNVIHIKIL